mmetsp:Transcript_71711/g.198957  ORF Transcript_71711/g.198957 Transcript_71711/m.198957 type:complete len:601 (-) Transcript_71711:82-1884(-)
MGLANLAADIHACDAVASTVADKVITKSAALPAGERSQLPTLLSVKSALGLVEEFAPLAGPFDMEPMKVQLRSETMPPRSGGFDFQPMLGTLAGASSPQFAAEDFLHQFHVQQEQQRHHQQSARQIFELSGGSQPLTPPGLAALMALPSPQVATWQPLPMDAHGNLHAQPSPSQQQWRCEMQQTRQMQRQMPLQPQHQRQQRCIQQQQQQQRQQQPKKKKRQVVALERAAEASRAQRADDCIQLNLSSALGDCALSSSAPVSLAPYREAVLRKVGAGEHLCDAGEEKFAAILETVLPDAVELACSATGRVVLEELLERGTRAQRIALAERFRGSMLRLSMDSHGCWCIQKVIQHLPCEALFQLVSELASSVEECIESKHGNFVVQACIEQLPLDPMAFVVAAIECHARHFGTHRYGCRVVQRLLEHCSHGQTARIIDQVVDATLEFSRNQYGCHVLRCILDHGRAGDKRRIMEVMRANILRLSRNRLSSLVIEKCFEVASEGEHASALRNERAALIHAVFSCGSDAEEDVGCADRPLVQMAGTRFGRSILRRILDCAPAGEREALQQNIAEVVQIPKLLGAAGATTASVVTHAIVPATPW